ncbi:UvrD-helicase domain-containing protein, partial [Bacteroidota bacterium]
RKVHNVLFAPDFETVEKIQHELQKRKFNITSDGRPILGLDSKDLLDLVLNVNDEVFFVPAHIWTPWFSVLGEKSGFDSVEECFEELSKYIYAVETGLSSDPPMNWTCSILDKYTLLSNSDAHSPEKLGRNANYFNTDMDYDNIITAIKSKNNKQFIGTIDLFPQEGKYHYAGHRKCNICWDPVETAKYNGVCTSCNKPITNGVMNRVIQLSDREEIDNIDNRPTFFSIIPLKEILSEIYNCKPNSNKIEKEYIQLINKFGSEFNILLHNSVDEIKEKAGDIIGEAIRRMRNREVIIQEGYDGEYGVIKVFDINELTGFTSQKTLFKLQHEKPINKPEPRKLLNFNLKEYQELNVSPISEIKEPEIKREVVKEEDTVYGLNANQTNAVKHLTGPALVLAGPGTGKTRVLSYRIQYLIEHYDIPPENILAVTFTNKAANEIRERVNSLINEYAFSKISINTFHSFGLKLIKQYYSFLNRSENFILIDDTDKIRILQKIGYHKNYKQIINAISKEKQALTLINEIEDAYLRQVFINYDEYLYKSNAFDLDDLLYQSYRLLMKNIDILEHIQEKYKYIIIDEYQDINLGQYELIKLMSGGEQNLMAIGDPNQAIYGFRGSDVTYINKFTSDFNNADIYKLSQSYRCTNTILEASNNILKLNEGLEGIQQGLKINIQKNATEKSEAEYVARTIEKMIGGLRFFSMDSNISEGNEDYQISSLSDFAVLARTKSLLKPIEKAFNDHSIPSQLIGEEKLTDLSEIKNIISVLRYIETKNELYLSNDLKIDVINNSSLKNIKDSRQLLERITQLIHPEFINNYEDHFKLLINVADQSGNITELIRNISLRGEIEIHDYNIEKVGIMTLHAAKGLEFECVFIVGCEDGLLPYWSFSDDQNDIEEERRLLYVGMTRAKKYLYLSHAINRFYNGKQLKQNISPFIHNIQKKLLEFTETEKVTTNKPVNQLNLFD